MSDTVSYISLLVPLDLLADELRCIQFYLDRGNVEKVTVSYRADLEMYEFILWLK